MPAAPSVSRSVQCPVLIVASTIVLSLDSLGTCMKLVGPCMIARVQEYSREAWVAAHDLEALVLVDNGDRNNGSSAATPIGASFQPLRSLPDPLQRDRGNRDRVL